MGEMLPADGLVTHDLRDLASVRPVSMLRTSSDEDVIRLWLEAVGAGSENTFAAYRAETLRFLAWLRTKAISLECLVYEDVKDFEAWLKAPPEELVGARRPVGSSDWRPFATKDGLSPRSVDRALSVIANLYSFLHDSGRINTNPVKLYRAWNKNARKKDLVQRTQKFLPPPSEAKVVQWLRGHTDDATAADRWAVGALYFLGLRISELCSARMSDLSQSDGMWFLTVLGKGNKARNVAVSAMAMQLLAGYRQQIGLKPEPAGEDWPLVGSKRNPRKAITRRAMYERVVKTGLHVVPPDPGKDSAEATIHPHLYRHAAATRWIALGANLLSVRDQLGHSSVTTTEIYAKRNNAARHTDTAGLDDRVFLPKA